MRRHKSTCRVSAVALQSVFVEHVKALRLVKLFPVGEREGGERNKDHNFLLPTKWIFFSRFRSEAKIIVLII